MPFTIIVFSLVILIYSIYYKVWLNPGSNLIQLYTPWGENLDRDNILQEYPRPQYQRNSYFNLNGKWKYALREKGMNLGDAYDGDIYVPFSIESPLSGVGKSLKPGMTLFYNKKVDLSRMENKGKFLLNFGAVDQETDVYINEKWVGNHKGGYLSFSFDITEFVIDNLSNVDIIVRVFDNLKENGEAYGKQSNPRGIYIISQREEYGKRSGLKVFQIII